jgi:hypothetical protein
MLLSLPGLRAAGFPLPQHQARFNRHIQLM